jgi:DnaJ-class molecular chaperone
MEKTEANAILGTTIEASASEIEEAYRKRMVGQEENGQG